MDWHVVLGVIGGILAMVAVIPYIRDIVHGSTRPNVVSWLLWELLLLISTLAQISAGASWSLLFLIGDLVGTGIIVLLCFVGYGYGKYGNLEWVCTFLTIAAVVSWRVTQQPLFAIFFVILADALAAIPTVVKTYRDPWSEAPTQWFIIACAAVLAMVSSKIFNLSNLAFPAYLFFINGLIGNLSFFGRRLTSKPFSNSRE